MNLEIFGWILGSSGLFSMFMAILQRHWSKKDGIKADLEAINKKVDDVKTTLTDHIEEDREKDAIMARRDVLRFNDEVRRGQAHTAESFDDILEAADSYKRYCDDHPKFENNKAVIAIGNIKRVYKERLEKNDFL